jgi:hypothetical protein
MTQTDALNAARAMLDPTAALDPTQGRPSRCPRRIRRGVGCHRRDEGQRLDRTLLLRASGSALEADAYVMRQMWHLAGAFQTAYRIGILYEGRLHLRVAPLSSEDCLVQLQTDRP